MKKEKYIKIKEPTANLKFFIINFIFLLFFFILAQFIIYNKEGNLILSGIFYIIAIFNFFIIERFYKIESVKIEVSKKTEIIFFILIVIIALFLRFYKINEIPPDLFADEGNKGYEACKMINGEKIDGQEDFFLPVHSGDQLMQTATTYIYLAAPFIKFFGNEKIEVKIPSVILGFLAVISFYFLVRKMYGAFPAILGGFIIATLRWHITYSRIAWENMISIFSIILVLYFGWRLYFEKKLIDFVGFGFALALTQYGYQSSRIVPLWAIVMFIYILFADIYSTEKEKNKIFLKAIFLILILFLTYLIIFILKKFGFWQIFMEQSLYKAIIFKKNELNKIIFLTLPIFIIIISLILYLIKYTIFLKENFGKIILSIFVFLIFFSPMLIYIYKYQFAWLTRGRVTLIWNNLPENCCNNNIKKFIKTFEMYGDNIKKSLLGFINKGDGNPRWNFPGYPHLEFFTAIFFIIGFLVYIKKFFVFKEFFILSNIIVLSQATLLNTENPNASRSAIIIPAVVILIVAGILKLVDYINHITNNKKIIFFILAILFVIIGFNNYKQYFIDQLKNPDFQYGFSPEEYNMAMDLKKLGSDWRGIILLRYELRRTFKYLMYKDNSWMTFAPYANIPVRKDDGKNYIYMSTFENLPIVPIIKDIYPNGEYSEFRTKYWPHDVPVYFRYKVPNSDIKNALLDFEENKRGLAGYYYSNVNWQGNPVTITVEPFLFFRHYYCPVSPPYSMDFKGKIKIDIPGKYFFKIASTSDTELYIDDKKILQVDFNDKSVEFTGISEIYLTKGLHKIRVTYNFKRWHMELELRWKKPGDEEFEVVPYKVLFRD